MGNQHKKGFTPVHRATLAVIEAGVKYYEAEKAAWARANPNATSAQYEAQMLVIAKKYGV